MNLAKAEDAQLRTWTRVADGKAIQAKFVGLDQESKIVTLKMASGKVVEIAANILSQDDQSWLDEQSSQKSTKIQSDQEAVSLEIPLENVNGKALYVRYPKGLAEAGRVHRPLCIIFSPSSKPRKIMKKMELAADTLQWTLVGVDVYSNKKVQKSLNKVIKDTKVALTTAFEKVPHDKNKVVLAGMSGGAWWSYRTSANEYFKTAGIIAFGGWMSEQYNLDFPRRMKVAMVNGDKDSAVKWEKPDGDFLRKKKKATVKAFHFPGGHIVAPPDVCLEAAQWLHLEAQFDE